MTTYNINSGFKTRNLINQSLFNHTNGVSSLFEHNSILPLNYLADTFKKFISARNELIACDDAYMTLRMGNFHMLEVYYREAARSLGVDLSKVFITVTSWTDDYFATWNKYAKQKITREEVYSNPALMVTKPVGGLTYINIMQPELFFSLTTEDQFAAIKHELIHVRQIQQGRLYVTRNDIMTWDGEIINQDNSYLKEGNFDGIIDLPFEVEAWYLTCPDSIKGTKRFKALEERYNELF